MNSSSYFGESNLGNERGGSSRKGKKSNSDKPKQPQRGLGVAQLEKIRLQSQLGTQFHPNTHGPYPINFSHEDMRVHAASSPFGFHPGFVMGLGEYERADINYGQSSSTARSIWDSSKGIQNYSQQTTTRHFLQETEHKNQNSDSSDTQEVDLELRLSL